MGRWDRIGTRMIVASALVLVVTACGSDADDSGDSVSETTAGTSGGLATGTVATPEAVVPETVELGQDYNFTMPEGQFENKFNFEVPPGAVVTVTASAPDSNKSVVGVELGPTGQTVARLEIPSGSAADPVTYVTSATGGGRWSVNLRATAGDTVGFRMEAPIQVDGGTAGDAGADAGSTQAIELGTTLSGLLGDEDGEDWYAIPLSGGDVVSIELDMLADTGFGGVFAEILHNGSSLTTVSINPGGEQSLTQIFSVDQTGEAQLRVSGNGVYGFSVHAGPQTDGGTDGDAGGDQGSAKATSFGTFDGVLGGSDRDDFYVLELPMDAVVLLEATVPPSGNSVVNITLTHNGRRLGNFRLNAGQTEQLNTTLVNDADSPVYLHATGIGEYHITIESFTQTDGGTEGDAGNDEGTAQEITADGSFDGYLNNGEGDGHDWYIFTATTTTNLDVTLAVDADFGANVRMSIKLLGSQGGANTQSPKGGSSTATLDVEAGSKYVIHLITGQSAAYTVTFG